MLVIVDEYSSERQLLFNRLRTSPSQLESRSRDKSEQPGCRLGNGGAGSCAAARGRRAEVIDPELVVEVVDEAVRRAARAGTVGRQATAGLAEGVAPHGVIRGVDDAVRAATLRH